MRLHPAAAFVLPGGAPVPFPITWWPLLQPISWRQDREARRYLLECEHLAIAVTDNALLAAPTHYEVVTLVYGCVIRLGHAVAAYHQGLFARDLRGHLDDQGYLFPAPAGPPWYHPADGHPAP